MISEQALIELVNDYLDTDVYLEDYQTISFYITDQSLLKALLHDCKYKDVGSAFDFPEIIPKPSYVDVTQLATNFDMVERIAVSEKFNSIMTYSSDTYFISCQFLIDTSKLKKFAKKVKPLISRNASLNMFRDVSFDCPKGKYIEIANTTDDKTRMVDVVQCDIRDEKLVFDPKSVIADVKGDITTFFTEKTQKLYERLNIPYKRGIILYGDPGNGKSAMIREIIRTLPTDICKIVINPGIRSITAVLDSLVKALKGKQAIIVIEDIDSVINDQNRSEFLNILDGVNIVSGIFFIGTTNYPDRVDPAFMNRCGRFDRTYKIDNPSEEMRRLFFEDKKVGEILDFYKVYKDNSIPDSSKGIVDLFVKYSDNIPMANLKELITSTSYLLAVNEDQEMTVEEALEKTYNVIAGTREEHVNAYNNAQAAKANTQADDYDDEDDDELY